MFNQTAVSCVVLFAIFETDVTEDVVISEGQSRQLLRNGLAPADSLHPAMYLHLSSP